MEAPMLEGDYLPHPYTRYNKPPVPGTAPTLIGNWEEERALKEKTGTGRYEPWATHEQGASIYATKAVAAELPTHPRTIEHSHQTAPQNWKSVQQASYKDPQKVEKFVDYKDVATLALGPRERMELEALMAEARDLPSEEEAKLTGRVFPRELETTFTDSYRGHDVTGLTIGAKVMKDRDGRPAVRDPTFLAETQLIPRQLADRVMGDAAKAAGATQTTVLPNPDTPITLYTEMVATRKMPTGTTRPIAGAPSAFGKMTNFSKPMSEYNKVVIDE